MTCCGSFNNRFVRTARPVRLLLVALAGEQRNDCDEHREGRFPVGEVGSRRSADCGHRQHDHGVGFGRRLRFGVLAANGLVLCSLSSYVYETVGHHGCLAPRQRCGAALIPTTDRRRQIGGPRMAAVVHNRLACLRTVTLRPPPSPRFRRRRPLGLCAQDVRQRRGSRRPEYRPDTRAQSACPAPHGRRQCRRHCQAASRTAPSPHVETCERKPLSILLGLRLCRASSTTSRTMNGELSRRPSPPRLMYFAMGESVRAPIVHLARRRPESAAVRRRSR